MLTDENFYTVIYNVLLNRRLIICASLFGQTNLFPFFLLSYFGISLAKNPTFFPKKTFIFGRSPKYSKERRAWQESREI
jgi:hypothetical protein